MASLSLFSSSIAAVLAVAGFALMVLTWMAAERSGHTKVRFVAAAFGVLSVKSAIVSFGLLTGSIEHEILEVVEALFDAAMITLLAIPFWARG